VADEKKLNLIFDFHDQDLKQYLDDLGNGKYLDPFTVKVDYYCNQEYLISNSQRSSLLSF